MKKILLLVITIITISNGFSQHLPDGAKWLYDQDKFTFPSISNYRLVKNIGDTTINGVEASILNTLLYKENSTLVTDMGNMYINFDQRVLNYYNPWTSTFYQVYDFSKVKGDTVLSYCPLSEAIFPCLIDSTGVDTINGHEHFWQMYRPIESQAPCTINGKVYEGIGGMEWILPRSSWADPPAGGFLLCYKDDNANFNANNAFCDSYVSVLSLPNDKNTEKLKYTQNSEEIIILNSNSQYVQLVDIVGQNTYKSFNRSINISGFSSGMYVLRVQLKTGELLSTKIMLLH